MENFQGFFAFVKKSYLCKINLLNDNKSLQATQSVLAVKSFFQQSYEKSKQRDISETIDFFFGIAC